MKTAYFISVSLILLTACSVKVQDKETAPEVPAQELNELIVEKEFSFPRALVQSEKIVLRYDRLVLHSGAQLITQGGNLRIEVGELIADQAFIRSFKEGQKAAQGQAGRNGGNLELIVGKASGHLTLEMRGEDGSDGRNGQAPDEKLRGTKGINGKNAVYINGTSLIQHGKIRVASAEGGGGGGTGLRGYPGENGFRGGDSGNLILKIDRKENFGLKTLKSPGRGGLAGVGGAGGKGGFGGDPGKDLLVPNLNTSPGPQGADGPQGPDGIPGIPGNPGKFCLAIGDALFQCE